jgi:enoyl-CoA hydratase
MARVDLQVDGALATLTLQNPARRNAMTRAMWRALRETAAQLPSTVRCVLVRGEGGQFCAGGDISEYPSFRFDEATLRHFHEEEVAPALEALLGLDVPLVAQIEGHCMGGGLEIASCCDIRIAQEGATFGAPIAKLGMPMASRELAIVLRAAGELSVREMLLEARAIDAATMLARGFLHRVMASAAAEAQETAERIANLSPQAARMNKQALRALLQPHLSSNLEPNRPLAGVLTAQAAINNVANNNSEYGSEYAYASSAEHIEGIRAFLEKRKPRF